MLYSPRLFRATVIAVGIVSLLATGCGSDSSTVTGTVTYRGKPLTGGSVMLYCADQQIVRGTIDENGTYTIVDVPRGPARVTVQTHGTVPLGLRTQQPLPPASPDKAPPPIAQTNDRLIPIPPRYATPDESGLSVTVEKGLITYDIDLKP